jgi:hypothetical protein
MLTSLIFTKQSEHFILFILSMLTMGINLTALIFYYFNDFDPQNKTHYDLLLMTTASGSIFIDTCMIIEIMYRFLGGNDTAWLLDFRLPTYCINFVSACLGTFIFFYYTMETYPLLIICEASKGFVFALVFTGVIIYSLFGCMVLSIKRKLQHTQQQQISQHTQPQIQPQIQPQAWQPPEPSQPPQYPQIFLRYQQPHKSEQIICV